MLSLKPLQILSSPSTSKTSSKKKQSRAPPMEEAGCTNYKSFLFTRDFLIRNNGDKVTAEEALAGKKTIGVYFSAHWCPPCRDFTPMLARAYEEHNRGGGGGEFEVVFVSRDKGQESFEEYFKEMPWLAVPFSDEAVRERLKGAFGVRGIPHLALVDGETGEAVEADAVALVSDYGAEALPLSKDKVEELRQREEEARRNQTVTTVLASASRHYLLAADGSQVQVSDLEGKMVAIFFSAKHHGGCAELSPILAKMCSDLKQQGEAFEVVLVPLENDESDYKSQVKDMPWLSLPFNDESIDKLVRYFELESLPTLALLGVDGKTISSNLAETVLEHGINAYPFLPEKLAELAELEKKRKEEQTLESILVSGELDYVVGKDGAKVPVKDMVGKVVLLYFSAHWCPPCRSFTPKLVEVYNELKSEQREVEVVFVSSDRDQSAFEEYYSGMPWLALPHGDKRKGLLNRRFKVRGIPTLVALDTGGRTVTTDARKLVMEHGAKAFPFTEEQIGKIMGETVKEGYVCEGDVCRKA